MDIVNFTLALLKIIASIAAAELDISSCHPKPSEHQMRQGKIHRFYRGSIRDHVLRGQGYRNGTTSSYLTCAGMCLWEDACKSFNFCRDDKSCELNSAVYSKDKSDLQFSRGCLYFDEEFHKECRAVVAAGDYVYNFIFPPLKMSDSFRLDFTVKCKSDALLALAEHPNEDNYYDVVIGGWGNTKSAIRNLKHGTNQVFPDTPYFMDEHEYRRFWLIFDNWTIQVGRGGEVAPFMEWHDAGQRVQVKYIGIASYVGNPVSWIFYSFCDD